MATHPLKLPVFYTPLCTVLGLVLGWAPLWLHGPIPQKFDVLYIQGDVAVWGWYSARLSVGFWFGVSTWPGAWWLRGPLCGALLLLPLTLVSLGMPQCGWPCMRANLASGVAIGASVGALSWALTGRHHR